MSDLHGPDPRPADDEPRSPLWLPALGAALFIAAGVAWAAMETSNAPGAGGGTPAGSASGAAPSHS